MPYHTTLQAKVFRRLSVCTEFKVSSKLKGKEGICLRTPSSQFVLILSSGVKQADAVSLLKYYNLFDFGAFWIRVLAKSSSN